MTVDPGVVAEHLEVVRARIARAGDPSGVRIVAVTKGFGADAIAAAVTAGLSDVGENYAQELVAKHAELPAGVHPTIHFIGHVQTNKVRQLAGIVGCWQTVDRHSLIDELARRAPGAAVLVQVNISGEAQKSGCSPSDVSGLVNAARQAGLVVDGLMGIGPLGEPEEARPGFRLLRALTDDLGLTVCSMGMTDDLEIAVEEGSTMVRVGSALFGPRPLREPHGK